MFNSLNKLKNLPIDTKIYCGHEYTKKNLEFCLAYDSRNKFLGKKNNWINSKLRSKSPTVPVTIGDQIDETDYQRIIRTLFSTGQFDDIQFVISYFTILTTFVL